MSGVRTLRSSSYEAKIHVMRLSSFGDLNSRDQKKIENIEVPLKSFCSELNIEFIGLYEYFKKSNLKTSNLFFECDSHWTSYGHKKAMEVVMKHSETYKSIK